MRWILLFALFVLIWTPLVRAAERSDGEVSLIVRGQVESARVVEDSGSASASIQVDVQLEIKNDGRRAVLILERDIRLSGVAVAGGDRDFSRDGVLAADYVDTARDRSSEWLKLRSELNAADPPVALLKVLQPGEAVFLKGSATLDVPLDANRYTSSRKKATLLELMNHSRLWILVRCDMWPSNLEENPEGTRFGLELRRRWWNRGVLWLEPLTSEPMMLNLNDAQVERKVER